MNSWRATGVLSALTALTVSPAAFSQEVEPPVVEEAVECLTACPVEHPQVSLIDGVCTLGDGLGDGPNAVVISESLTLCAGDYLLTDQISVGVDGGEETALTLSAGVTVLADDATFLSVQRGSKLLAAGTSAQPVVLTSAQPEDLRAAGDWGGLVLNGFATLNVAGGVAEGEAGTGVYGGTNDTDSSGSIQYLRVEYGGAAVDEDNELNGIAFQGVGSGTFVDHVHVHENGDDGVEFFGGTVNVSNLLLTGNHDDSIDWTQGYRGTIDTVTVIQGPDADKGIEADGLSADPTALPLSDPTLRNVVLIGSGLEGSTGALFRVGTRVTLIDATISNFATCMSINGEDSTTAALNGELVMDNVVFNCPIAADPADLGAQALLASGGIRSLVAAAPAVEEGPAEAPSEEAPSEEAPSEEAPSEEAPSEEAPAP
jgi:hypothetical protein